MAAADVQVWLNQILSARYGEDVRQSIYNSIKFFNQEVVRFDYELNNKASQINQDANRAEAAQAAAEKAKTDTVNAGTSATTAINTAKNQAVTAITTAQTTATNAVNKAGTDAQAAIAEDVQEVSDMTEANQKIQEGIEEIVDEATKGYVKKTGDTITGVVKAPTPTSGSDPKQLATKEYVDNNAGSGGGSGGDGLRKCKVGSFAATGSHWWKFASWSPTGGYQDARGTFLITPTYKMHSDQFGILRVYSRNEKTTQPGPHVFKWVLTGPGINLNNFVLAFNNTTPGIIELWLKTDYTYQTYEITLLDDGYVSNNISNDDCWFLHDNVGTTGETINSSYTQINSTMETINANLQNYLASNNWAKFQKRKSTNSYGPVWCSTANTDTITAFLYAYLLQSSASVAPVLRFDRYVADANGAQTGNAQPIILDNIDPNTLFRIIQKYNWVYDEKLFELAMRYIPPRIKVTTNDSSTNNKYMKLVEIDSGSAGMVRIQGHLSEYTTVSYVDISLRGTTINNSTTAESLMIVDNSYGRFNAAYLNLLIVNENNKATVYIKKGTYNWVACNLTISTSLDPSLVHVISNVSWISSLPDNTTVLYNWYDENTKHYSTNKYPVFSSAQNAEIFSLANNAGAHNSIFRGKNLGTSITSAQSAAIAAGTFEDMYIGDYWINGGVTYRIVAFDYAYNTSQSDGSDLVTNHHIVVMADGTFGNDVVYSNTTSFQAGGDLIAPVIYGSGKLVPSSEQMLYVPRLIGKTFRPLTGLFMSVGYSINLAFIPSEVQIYGSQRVSAHGGVEEPPLPYGEPYSSDIAPHETQFPLFSLAPQFIPSTNPYWLTDIVSYKIPGDNYYTTFALVVQKGGVLGMKEIQKGGTFTSLSKCRIRPYYLIKGSSTATASLNAIPDAAPSLE